ncbi:MAG TPA: DUF1549 domain-containing protein, partial [Bryobacterales bacterium]|nr:DUF1549 domain-containing protein [Bryobacterales bacterium]
MIPACSHRRNLWYTKREVLAFKHKLLFSSLLVALAVAFLLAPRSAPAAPETGVKPVDFDRDIRGILSDNCYACHGPDEKNRQAGLRLDSKDGPQSPFAPRKGYQILASGNSAQSRLYRKISAADKNLRMPPPYANRSLTAEQVALIRRWIDEGAKWETHWAYVAPKRPEVPKVKDASWPRNAIDNFILTRLESEGLKPSPEADKVTLLRRVTFDLTGLPPTPAEMDAFLADHSPHAYEKQVDRLLASPRYGERMAMQWLDLARYADTHGYHIDPAREMWHWRDWVIDAFNRNMPFDEFTIEQLAGDLLPHPTRSQLIATGFNRNHMINFEGGAIPDEYQVEYVVDRVETTSVTWMGMTLGCARCHDHKYDPLKQRDFYRFYAFFNTIPEKGLDGRKGNAAPLIQLPSSEQERELSEVKTGIAAAEKAMPAESELASLQSEWEKAALDKLPAATRDGLLAHYELNGSFGDSSGRYRHGRIRTGDLTYNAGPLDRAAEFDGETEVDLDNGVALDRSKPFSIAVWLRSGNTHELQVMQKIADAQTRRGFEMTWEESYPIGHLQRGAKLSLRLTSRWPDDAIEVRTKRALPISSKEGLPRPWYQVTVNYDGSGRASGLKLFVNGREEPLEVAQDKLSGAIGTDSPWSIGSKKLGHAYKGAMDDLRFYGRALTPAEISDLAIEQPIRATLWLQPAKRAKDQKAALREYFLTHA